MKKGTVALAVCAAVACMLGGVPGAGAKAVRHDYPYVQIWCDSDATNGDGTGPASITPGELTSREGAVDDDVIAKVIDGSSLDPGNHEIATGHFNAVAGVIQGWYCGKQVWVFGPS
jgi:hypothetical protein